MIVLKYLSNFGYLLMNFSSLSLAIYGLINIKKLGDLKIFVWLPILSFIDSFSLILFVTVLDQQKTFLFFSSYFQIIYLISELAIIIFFYSRIIFNVKSKSFYFITIIILFLLLSSRYFTDVHIANDYLPVFVVIEALIINICFGILISHKFKDDSFNIGVWANHINKGLFLFINTTSPYYLVNNFFDTNEEILNTYLNFIGSLGYIILFYHIYKAKKCYQLK